MKKICTVAIFASLGVCAEAQSSCEAHETLLGGDCVYDLGTIGVTYGPVPRYSDHEVPYYQENDHRDEPWGRGGGGGGGGWGDDEDETEDPYMRCSSTVQTKRLMTLQETDSFRQQNQDFSMFVSGLGGALATVAASRIPVIGSASAPFIGASTAYWLNDKLSYGALHCGDTIRTEVTICIDFSVPPNPLSPPLATRSVDTTVLHTHIADCDDGYMIPQWAFSEEEFNGGTKSLTYAGVTHVIPSSVEPEATARIFENIRSLANHHLNRKGQREVRVSAEAVADGILYAESIIEGQGLERLKE